MGVLESDRLIGVGRSGSAFFVLIWIYYITFACRSPYFPPSSSELNSKILGMSFEYFPTTESNFPKYCYEHVGTTNAKTFYVSTSTENMLSKYIPGGAGGTALCVRGESIMMVIYCTANRDLYIGQVNANNINTGGIWKSYEGSIYAFD